MVRYLPFVLLLVVWIYAFVDCLNTPEDEVRKLPKVAWVLIILLFGQVLLGPVAWFWVGRPRRHRSYGATRPGERAWVAPDDNPEFLKSLNDLGRTSGTGTDGTGGAGASGGSRPDGGRPPSRPTADGDTPAGAGDDARDPRPENRGDGVRDRDGGEGGGTAGSGDTPAS